MKAVIHIGTEKTGTTTLQEFLHLNRANLKNQGIAYLQSPGERNNRKLATYCMNHNNVDDHIEDLGIISESKKNTWKAKFKRELDQEMKNLDKTISLVIISSEHFHSRLGENNEIKKLFNLLMPYFLEIKILVYLRRQDQVAVSFYSTLCKKGWARPSVLVKNESPDSIYYNYYNLIERWANVFGRENLNIRIFDKNKFINGDLLQDFFYATGIIKFDNFIIPKQMNEKLSASVQNALMLLNKYFPRKINNNLSKVNNQLRDYVISDLSEKYKEQEKLPSKHEAIEFYKIFFNSNQKLADQYFSSKSIFSDNFSMYPEESDNEVLNKEIIQDIFYSISNFLNNRFITPKIQLNKVNKEINPGIILRDLALEYELESPEICLFLMEEARKYRPKGPFILEKIKKLKKTLYMHR